jgi:phosphoribosylanthranilate isomerase
MSKVKLCGITNATDAALCAAEGADALGFIFCAKSPRCVSSQVAAAIVKDLPASVMSVGVFVDEPLSDVQRIVEQVGLDAVQLHGKEPVAYCAMLKTSVKVIKSFFPKDECVFDDMRRYANAVDMVLIDTPFDGKGTAAEQTHDRTLASRIIEEFRWCVYAGGVNVENVDGIMAAFSPYMVDVARGSESEPGKKDPAKVKRLIAAIKGC